MMKRLTRAVLGACVLVVIAAMFPRDLPASGVGPTGRVPWGHVVELPRLDKTVYVHPGDHLTIVLPNCCRHIEIAGFAYKDGVYQVLHSAVAARDTVTVVVIVRGQGVISFFGGDGFGPIPVSEVRNVRIEIGEPRK